MEATSNLDQDSPPVEASVGCELSNVERSKGHLCMTSFGSHVVSVKTISTSVIDDQDPLMTSVI